MTPDARLAFEHGWHLADRDLRRALCVQGIATTTPEKDVRTDFPVKIERSMSQPLERAE